MSKIPAKCSHAHYLFEDGVLEFDEPVEIHVSRFGPNMQKICTETVPGYPEYQVHFEEPSAFKVYVNSGKKNADGSIKVKKVNFGHGGTSAKKAGQKTMSIRKSNPKARSTFRARHNCDSPGPKTMARYWSCKKW